MKVSSTSRLSRRHFLFAVGAGGAATAGALAVKQKQAETKKVSAAPAGKGYQLTEHVRKYYETTKV